MNQIQTSINHALMLHRSGRILEAIRFYELALIDRSPSDPFPLYLIGTAYYQIGNHKKALRLLNASIEIKPDLTEAYVNRGNLLRETNHIKQSLYSYDLALRIDRNNPDAHYNRSICLTEEGLGQQAYAGYVNAIISKPFFAEAYCNLGNALKEIGDTWASISSYKRSIKINPEHKEALYNLAKVLTELDRSDEALQIYNQVIAFDSVFEEAYNNRGNILKDLGRLSEAFTDYGHCLRLNPNNSDFYNNHGIVLQEFGQMKDALISFNRALKVDPDSAEAQWNKSLLLILSGSFLEGWALYESRWAKKCIKNHKNRLTPEATIHSNDRVFIHHEQGLGDTIQFCRYAKKFTELNCSVVIQVQPSLLPLISSLDQRIRVISSDEEVPDFDHQSPMLSLPWVFGTTVETIPSDDFYLSVSTEKRVRWGLRLGTKSKPRVGLVWSGNPRHRNDNNRSIRFVELLPILDESIEWHSLQREYNPADVELLKRHPEIHQHQAEIEDFTDTAALLEQMDLVISVDTSVAHLAGALGKSLWLLLPYVPDCRWLLDREDSPWYPSARLYRQTRERSWRSVIPRIEDDLLQQFQHHSEVSKE